MSHHQYSVETVIADRLREAALARRHAAVPRARETTAQRPRLRRRPRIRFA